MPHLGFALLAAILLSASLALLDHRTRRERLDVAIYFMLCCAASTLVGSWVMYLIHG